MNKKSIITMGVASLAILATGVASFANAGNNDTPVSVTDVEVGDGWYSAVESQLELDDQGNLVDENGEIVIPASDIVFGDDYNTENYAISDLQLGEGEGWCEAVELDLEMDEEGNLVDENGEIVIPAKDIVQEGEYDSENFSIFLDEIQLEAIK